MEVVASGCHVEEGVAAVDVRDRFGLSEADDAAGQRLVIQDDGALHGGGDDQQRGQHHGSSSSRYFLAISSAAGEPHDAIPGNAGGHYRTSEDVDIYTPASGTNATSHAVNNIETGEWLEYTIDVPSTVPSTGWWGTYAWYGTSGVTLAAGQHVLRVHSEQEYFNLNAIRITQ
ncbi:MAG TPA: hypothetical protein VEO54_07365 [Thermoanaerobaculia bacterium]|nr:hypothetical protein [Thermoanaerobaculia bacterium]